MISRPPGPGRRTIQNPQGRKTNSYAKGRGSTDTPSGLFQKNDRTKSSMCHRLVKRADTVDSRISGFGQGCSTGGTPGAFHHRSVPFSPVGARGRAATFLGPFLVSCVAAGGLTVSVVGLSRLMNASPAVWRRMPLQPGHQEASGSSLSFTDSGASCSAFGSWAMNLPASSSATRAGGHGGGTMGSSNLRDHDTAERPAG